MANIFLSLLFIILLINYLFFLKNILRGLEKIRPCKGGFDNEFISIIVPFRNESENILTSLKSLSEQDYPKDKFEILFVNDFSEDDSLQKLLSNVKNENVRILNVPSDYLENANKKRAVRYGIENCKGEIVVTTDADCTHSINWLKTLIQCMDKNTGFVSGPVEFVEDLGLFSKFQKLEFAGLVLAGAGLIGNDNPAICNAANIAYRKKIFTEVGGFNDKVKLSSGDDEILMQKIRRETESEIKFCWHQESVVKTIPNKNLAQFYHQRKRWASKGLFYGDKKLVLNLILIYFFYVGLIFQLALTFLISVNYLFLFILSLSLKYFAEYKIVQKGKKLLSLNNVMKFFPVAEILQIPYIIIAGFSGLLGNFNWKQRKIKR